MDRRQISGHVLRSATFGCVPISDDDQTRARLIDLCDALTDALGLPVRSHRAPSAPALANAYRAGRVHLAWTSAAAVATDPALADSTPLVRSVRSGMTCYHGVVFARRDGPITGLGRVPGARAAWVSATSASGYLFARSELLAAGVDPDTALGSQSFSGSHGAVVEAVANGEAEIGGTFAVYEDGDSKKRLVKAGFGESPEERRRFRVLLTTPPIPSDVVLAAPALLATLRVDPAEALGQLHRVSRAAAAMRHVLGAERFEPADASVIDALRAQIDAAGVSAAG